MNTLLDRIITYRFYAYSAVVGAVIAIVKAFQGDWPVVASLAAFVVVFALISRDLRRRQKA